MDEITCNHFKHTSWLDDQVERLAQKCDTDLGWAKDQVFEDYRDLACDECGHKFTDDEWEKIYNDSWF